jgi:hypothetical protein
MTAANRQPIRIRPVLRVAGRATFFGLLVVRHDSKANVELDSVDCTWHAKPKW